jgi:hypothetical protein
MSNSIRIRTTPNGGDKFLKVKLDQDFDFIEILSLKISQEETYRKFCSDYGVVVGRVIINSGFGVPNAKVSVFIPIDDVDKDNPVIKRLYPFEVITDKDSDGIRYNLFPKNNVTDNDCYTPIGTFPNKREVLDNDDSLYVYCKYYKFTTTTNHAGDFMFFGVPNGTYQVHVDADISDIGIASQRPYDLISQGTPAKLFDSPNKFKGGTNLNKLIQVKSANAGVNVQPFWGDTDNCEIGITRIDFDLNYNIRPAAIFMGSVFGDQDKHSINKRCRPRKKLGLMCEQVTGPGSVNMIRKTLDGGIEEFDVDGGRVIDDDGTWAYQIPMNLDYMVTDEFGNLILSEDPNIGIPTRSRVRFNIGMDETGGEGRLRTRARYLVPNNPQSSSEIDYSFDETTSDVNFRDIYWNKIYTVSNFVSRFQRAVNLDKVGTRSITAVKSVDECAGDKTPFPYNKVDTELNPIFFIICLIIKIIGIILYMINAFFIPVINLLIRAINSIMNAIVSVVCGIIDAINSVSSILGLTLSCGLSWSNIQPVGCITVKCPADDGDAYGPGCGTSDLFGSGDGYNAATDTPVYYPGDSFGHPNTPFSLAGLDDCLAFEMAKNLGLFHFDFYNDWVNGTLFNYLLKYKKKKNKREVFCEYDCSDFGGGIDGNSNGVPDNNCHSNLLLDTCYTGGGTHNLSSFPHNLVNSQKDSYDSNDIREGLIKKVGDEFYYAATTHNVNFKLFATDLVCVGSVFNCDWQGVPKIQPLLIPTSYKVPPDTQELADDNTTVEACGMVGIGGNTRGLFFEVNCLGVHVDDRQCLNIRHISEMGVEIDQALEDVNGNIITPSDCIIGSNDVDDAGGKWFRDVFTGLNSGTTMPTPLIVNNFTTNFNTSNIGVYDFASASDNGQDYIDFKGWGNSSSFRQPLHSYFFYYGILPGKTAVEKMNQRFFKACTVKSNPEFIIQASASPAPVSGNGSITFTVVGGTGPFTYSINGGTPVPFGGGTITLPQPAGTYTITVTDANGNSVNTTVVVAGPPALYATVFKVQDSSGSTSYNGIIRINTVSGGVPPYQCKLDDHLNNPVYGLTPCVTPHDFINLAPDSGYKVTIYDSALSSYTTTIPVYGANVLTASGVKTDVSCYGSTNGTITITTSGGVAPKSYSTTAFAFPTAAGPTLTNLPSNQYVTTVTDGAASTFVVTTTITSPPQLTTTGNTVELKKQCEPTYHIIPFYADSSLAAYPNGDPLLTAGPIAVEYSLDGSGWNTTGMTYTNSTTPMVLTIPSGSINTNIRIRYRMAYTSGWCYSNNVLGTSGISLAAIKLPTVKLNLTNTSLTTQCTPNVANVSLTIARDPARAPLTMEYSFNGGVTWLTGTSTSASVYTAALPLPVSQTYPTNSGFVNILYRTTDIVGCQDTVLVNNFKVPSVALSCAVSTTGPNPNPGPNFGKYTHVVTASGGIPSYTGTGTFIDFNPTYTANVTDSNGCAVSATG